MKVAWWVAETDFGLVALTAYFEVASMVALKVDGKVQKLADLMGIWMVV